MLTLSRSRASLRLCRVRASCSWLARLERSKEEAQDCGEALDRGAGPVEPLLDLFERLRRSARRWSWPPRSGRGCRRPGGRRRRACRAGRGRRRPGRSPRAPSWRPARAVGQPVDRGGEPLDVRAEALAHPAGELLQRPGRRLQRGGQVAPHRLQVRGQGLGDARRPAGARPSSRARGRTISTTQRSTRPAGPRTAGRPASAPASARRSGTGPAACCRRRPARPRSRSSGCS